MSEEYTRENPYIAKIKSRRDLCPGCPDKFTHHVVIDLSSSKIKYDVGDCVGVYPVNDPLLVERTLQAIGADGAEIVVDKRGGEPLPFEKFLQIKANVSEVSRKLIREIACRVASSQKREELEKIAAESALLKKLMEGRQLWDLLAAYNEARFSPQEICDLLMPLLPRYYSIASSQKEHPDEIHLTVKLLSYEAHGYRRSGVCTNYICNLAAEEEAIVPIFIQPHKGFTVPDDPNSAMIMIGPGTGVAPFRAFMQERVATGARGKHWLFFGEWRRENNYLYGDYWEELKRKGLLDLDLAFSRDQEEKHYVQHRLVERGARLYQWLMEGSYLYVCGDAKQMAKDVDRALVEIISTHGGVGEEEAKSYLKVLRQEKRYLRDVY